MREKQALKNRALKNSYFSILLIFSLLLLSPSYMHSVFSNRIADGVMIPEQQFFKDDMGSLNVVGVVRNNGSLPVQVVVGVNVTAGESDEFISNIQDTTIQNPTYSRIVHPSTESPFKFILPSNISMVSEAFIVDVEETLVPMYSDLVLNYSNVAVGENKALVGTVKNVGSIDLHDVSVYASVHGKYRTQIDSVKSSPISIIEPGQELPFSVVPNPSVREEVEYFSCAGVDLNAPITTLKVDDDEFIPFDLRAIAKITGLEYVNSTDSISFGVKHYNPKGGDLSLKVPQLSKNHSVFVTMDNEIHDTASIRADGKTLHIGVFVPPGDHEMNIQGIRDKIV